MAHFQTLELVRQVIKLVWPQTHLKAVDFCQAPIYSSANYIVFLLFEIYPLSSSSEKLLRPKKVDFSCTIP